MLQRETLHRRQVWLPRRRDLVRTYEVMRIHEDVDDRVKHDAKETVAVGVNRRVQRSDDCDAAVVVHVKERNLCTGAG